MNDIAQCLVHSKPGAQGEGVVGRDTVCYTIDSNKARTSAFHSQGSWEAPKQRDLTSGPFCGLPGGGRPQCIEETGEQDYSMGIRPGQPPGMQAPFQRYRVTPQTASVSSVIPALKLPGPSLPHWGLRIFPAPLHATLRAGGKLTEKVVLVTSHTVMGDAPA